MKLTKLTVAAVLAASISTPILAEDNAATIAALAELSRRHADDARIAKNLETFDDLNFEVFSDQQRDRLHESHAKDVLVHWPDGHTTTGIDVHMDDLKAFFVFAPDNKIEVPLVS